MVLCCFYLVHFTSDPFFFLLPNTTAFQKASSFNADISKWDVSRVTNMKHGTSFLANSWEWWSFVVFIWSISHLTLSSFSSQTQQPLNMLPRSTPTSASGTCQVWKTWDTVSLSLPIVEVVGLCCFIWSIFTSYTFFCSSSHTQQPLKTLKRSKIPTSASGLCQKWKTSAAVSLSLPIVDSGGPLLFYLVHFIHVVDSCGPLLLYLVHFTSNLSSFSSQKQQSLLVAPLTNYANLRSFKDFSWWRRRYVIAQNKRQRDGDHIHESWKWVPTKKLNKKN